MKKLVLSCFLLILFISTKAQLNLSSSGIAIYGYDPVSYFSNNPTKGKSLYQVKFKSATYNFSSEINKKTFIANPSKYLPEYGGYCAYAMGEDGSLVDIDPETYKIIDHKLYLFYNKYFTNTKEKWEKDEARLLKNADINWKKQIKK